MHNKKINDSYSLPNIIRVIKTNYPEHVRRKEREENNHDFGGEPKKKHFENVRVDRIILKYM
jgi:hypothetical protein